MVINFQTVQETLVALAAIVGIVVVFIGATAFAAAAARRDRVRHTPAHALSGPAQQPTQTDKVLELASR
jgi:hypothetical protein